MHRLALFAKSPVPGQVKTRLAQEIGPEAALKAYRDLLHSTLHRLRDIPACPLEIWIDGDPKHLAKFSITPPPRTQPPGDLGTKMLAAFTDGVSILVGADIPNLDADHILKAAHHLTNHDLVLGPTEDGGYYLIAMQSPHPKLFTNIPWSTNQVLTKTLERAQGLRTTLLDTLWDVDTIDDYHRWQSES